MVSTPRNQPGQPLYVRLVARGFDDEDLAGEVGLPVSLQPDILRPNPDQHSFSR
jgi:hypothetical protein